MSLFFLFGPPHGLSLLDWMAMDWIGLGLGRVWEDETREGEERGRGQDYWIWGAGMDGGMVWHGMTCRHLLM